MPRPTTIVAVTSLAREAFVARGSGVSVVCSQGARLGAALHAAIHPGVSGIISFGISGGLNPELVAGNWVVASTVRYRDRAIATDSKWTQELSKRLPGAVLADIVGSDTMVPTPAEKSHLFRTTGAVAVDMESHIAAEIAAAHQIPFAACRVIIDSAHRALPAAAGPALDSERRRECFCGDALPHANAWPASRSRSRGARCLHRRARLEKRPKAAGTRICVAICRWTRRRT